jgi:hypothetical protein
MLATEKLLRSVHCDDYSGGRQRCVTKNNPLETMKMAAPGENRSARRLTPIAPSGHPLPSPVPVPIRDEESDLDCPAEPPSTP